METEAFFQEKVYLTPKDLRNDVESVEDILLLKLKKTPKASSKSLITFNNCWWAVQGSNL